MSATTSTKVQTLQMTKKLHNIGKETIHASYQDQIHEKRGGFNHI